MSDALAPIAEKIKRCLRLLSSDNDGEDVAAARALNRTLKGANLDIHVLADNVGQSSGLTRAEMQKIYDAGHEAGFAAGRRAAEQELGSRVFRNINLDEEPSWYEIVTECAAHSVRLRDERERQFVRDLKATPRARRRADREAAQVAA